MKKLILTILVVVNLAACDDDSNNGPSSDAKVAEVQNTADEGQWRVTYFEDSGNEETNNFSGYIFEFDADNVLTATNGLSNHSGTWSVTDDSGSDDDNDLDDIDFNIAFISPSDFEELSEDWEIISISATKIELRHVSGGNGGTDLLTFEKV